MTDYNPDMKKDAKWVKAEWGKAGGFLLRKKNIVNDKHMDRCRKSQHE